MDFCLFCHIVDVQVYSPNIPLVPRLNTIAIYTYLNYIQGRET